jgi:hypothetical protein
VVRRSSVSTHRATPRSGGKTLVRLVVAAAVVLASVLIPASTAQAAIDASLQITKTANGAGPYVPGQAFSYTITTICSSPTASGCIDATLTDTLPAPLVFDPAHPNPVTAVVAGGGSTDVSRTGTSFTVDFTRDLGGGEVGLQQARLATITVWVKVPEDASADFNGIITNTAQVVAENAAVKTASADVTLAISSSLAIDVTKARTSAATVPAVPGTAVTWELGGTNASNQSVDTLVLQDPASTASPTTGPFQYLALTGLDPFTPPGGADAVTFEWLDASGTWHTSYDGVLPVPGGASSMLPADPTQVYGTRFTFTSTTGSIPVGAAAEIGLRTETRPNVSAIPDGTAVTVPNTVVGHVSSGAADSADDNANASVSIANQPPTVTTTKLFDRDNVLGGEIVKATIRSDNGDLPVHEMTIVEPGPGGDDLDEQGLEFVGFVASDIEWPMEATSASITYTYADGTTETLSTTDVGTLPEWNGDVVGFSVTFTAPGNGIEPSAYAVLPFRVEADPVSGTSPVTSTNTTRTTVTDAQSRTDSDDDTATIDRLPVQVDTHVGKSFTPTELYAAPGATTLVSLTGSVAQRPESTIGSDYLTISDPSGSPGTTPSEFWGCFTVRNITNTDVPAGTRLTVSYWTGSAWVELASQAGPTSNWSYTVPAGTRDAVQGLRFEFEPTTPGAVLAPGFNVAPNFNAVVRADCATDTVADTVVNNVVESEVANSANGIGPVTDADDADLTLHPLLPGTGPDLVDKTWVDPDDTSTEIDPVSTGALTGDVRTAKLRWSTGGLAFDTVTISDPGSQAELDDVADSVYEAFDLDRILPITSAQDPHIGDDRVTKVELYSDSTDTWVDVTAAACAAGCVGQFGGYDVPAGSGVGQEDDVIGVRLTFASRTSGEPVSISSAHDRLVRLDLRLRDTKRSDPSEYVLGQHHPGMTYNTGTLGLVRNSVEVAGAGAYDWADRDTADAVIIDKPLNVDLTKAFEYTPLGLPPTGTPQADYPLVDAVLEATNLTASRVSELQIADPVPGTAAASSVFDTLNLFAITAIDLPPGVDPTDVEVELTDAGGTTTPYTYAAALLLTPAALAGVVGVVVKAPGTIETDGRVSLRLTFQLRETERASGDPMEITDGGSDPVHVNVARANVAGPGGIGCTPPTTPCDNVQAEADDQFQIVPISYDVVATKAISPATRYEDQARTGYVATLSGQPTGSARTTVLTLTDDDPRFWNAFDYTGIQPFTPVGPVNELRLSVLSGVDYALSGSDLVATCAGSSDLSACWTTGAWTGAVGGTISLALPGSVAAADVRGVRVEARSVRSGTPVGWERPNNQRVNIRLDVTRRVNLLWSTAGTDTTPVPSTLPGMSLAPGEPTQGTIHDDLDVHGAASWSPGGTNLEADDDASATTQLLHRVNKIRVQKGPGNPVNPPLYENGATVPYVMTVTNTGAYTMTAPTFTVTDQITPIGGSSPVTAPSGDASFSFALFNGANVSQPVTGITGHLDETSGLVTVGFPVGFTFPSGWRLVISAGLDVRADLPAGTDIDNSVTASADRDFEECRYTTDEQTNNTSGSAASPVGTCTASTTIEVRADAPLQMTKSVKGVGAGVPGATAGSTNYDDLGVLAHNQADATACTAAAADTDGFYTYPCVPITRPGGTERWKVSFQNDGNVNASVVAGIDVLPSLNDEGVIVPVGRGSQWAPTLIGNFTDNMASLADGGAGQVQLFYSNTVPDNECNEADIRATTRPGGLPGGDPCAADVAGRTWLPVAGAPDLSGAKALKVVLVFGDASDLAETRGLQPGEELQLEFDTRTAPYADAGSQRDDGLSIAWNSVAAGSRNTGAGGQPASASLVTEPRQVGVAMPTGQLDISKLVVAPTWPSGVTLPDDYAFTVSCDSAGATDVPLLSPTGVDRSAVTVPVAGTVHYNGGASPATSWSHVSVPWNATCAVAEAPVAQGADVSYVPAGGTVVADTDLTGIANIHHPFAPTGTDTVEVTATNTYTSGGFTVTKTVDDGGAVDQDGDPVAYGPFGFTATCTFEGQEVLLAADRSFTVTAGVPYTVADLPTGSECTVTESDADGAADTDIEVTQGATTTPGTAGSVDFTVVEGAATTVAATNTFTTGSLEVTKTIDGPGAALWGDQGFTVRLACTLDGDTVYDGDSPALNAGNLVWSVDDLPTGASCTVTEPGPGGATTTTFTPAGGTVTIGDGSTVAVGVTNTFELGALTVTKDLTGPAAGLSGAQNGQYTMELSCTRDINGTDLPVAIPGGARQTIVGEGSATYDDLPTGARCSIAEVESVPATPHVVVTPSSVLIGDDPADPVEITVTNEFHDGSLELRKQVDGASAAVAPGTFDVTVTCEFPVGTPVALPNSGLVTLDADGTPVTLNAIPTGAQCKVTEADAGQTTVAYAPSDGVTIGDGTTTGVVITNVYRSGALVVLKSLAGVGSGVARGPFEFAVGCTFGGVRVLDTTLTLATTGLRSDPLVGIPVGSSCTVSETAAGNAVAPSADVTVTITDGSDLIPVVADVTNGFGAGLVRITKDVEGKYADEAVGLEFAVRVTCEYDAAGTRETVLRQVVTVRGGRTATVRDNAGDPVLLPVGSRCWGDETEDLDADRTVIDHGSRADAVVVESTSTTRPARIGISLVNTFNHPIEQTSPSDNEDDGDDGGVSGGEVGGENEGALPGTGAPFTPGLIVLAGLLVLGGALLVRAGRVRR